MSEEFFKICKDYGVPNDPMKYQDKKFYWTYQLVLSGQMTTLVQIQRPDGL